MLGQRMEPMLSSQTLPKLDGQDEDGEPLVETQFDMLCATNSCPDLSVLEEEQNVSTLEDPRAYKFDTVIRRGAYILSNKSEDQVDGIYIKHNQGSSTISNSAIPSKIPLGFRRSTSLNSLGVDQDFGVARGDSVTPSVLADSLDAVGYARGVGGGVAGGHIAAISAQLEKQLKLHGSVGVKGSPISATDFVRSKLRASDSGRPGYLHKSVSSPSVSQQFAPSSASLVSGIEHPVHQRQKTSNLTNFRATSQSDAHHHSSKRSFFRRKNKFKGHSMNAHGQSAAALHSFDTGTRMINGSNANNFLMEGTAAGNGTDDLLNESSLGLMALADPGLGLRDEDPELWVLTMSSELVSSLEGKEVKRQENMYEVIKTEKRHCVLLALMHHLFVGDMKKHGFSRQARLLFPDLKELLQVHFSFLKKLRERQRNYRTLGQPVDTIADILVDQFSGSQWQHMVRLYGLLCASHAKSYEIVNTLQKDPKFASLFATWANEPLLERKNVKETLLHVAQRITKYPLMFDGLVKYAVSPLEKEQLQKVIRSSKELISRVDERVAERQRLLEICQRIDSKSYVTIGEKRRGRDDLVSVASRRLLFHGQAVINCNRIGIGSLTNVACTVLILTDCLVFTQDVGGRLQFVCPPGIVMLSNLIVRPNAGQPLSMFLVISDSGKAEMIEIQVSYPPNREEWMEKIKEAKTKYEEKTDAFSDVDDDTADAVDHSEIRTAKALEDLQENDKQMLALLRQRSKLIETLRTDKPQNWVTNQLEGRENVLNAMAAACEEVRQMVHHIDANHVNAVNRSTSCVGDIGSSIITSSLQGLPKRADTFGGFDSQQRGLLGDQCSTTGYSINGRQLQDMVVQLADVCGEIFSLLVHQMSPIVYQNYYQLQRRMEDLREAQQRLETEKALWQQQFNSQKETIDKERNDLNTLKANLQKEQEDITQQREQLYRKLEASQKNPCTCNWKTLVPTPDSVSPGSSHNDKTVQSAIPRRPVVQSSNILTSSAHPPAVNNPKAKQQFPLHLASFSSSKGAGGGLSSSNLATSSSSSIGSTSTSGHNEPPPLHPKPHPRSSVLSSFKSSISASSLLQSGQNSSSSNQATWGQPTIKNSSSTSQVQQLLPLRLSEGTSSSNSSNNNSGGASSKTSSLPRGVTSSRSISSISQLEHPPQESAPSSGRVQRHSGTGNPYSAYNEQPSNPSYLHGPVSGSSSSERMNAYFSKPVPHPQSHHMQHYLSPNSSNGGSSDISPGMPISIVHRRSGSSPVPMTGTINSTNNTSNNPTKRHRFFQTQDDDDCTKILFL